MTRRPLTRAKAAEVTERIRGVLSDPDAGLSTTTRHREEGALMALEAVLGELPTVIGSDPDRFVLWFGMPGD